MRARLARDASGQVLPLLAAGLLVALLGIAGLAIDAGSWYHGQRHAQAVADAAALAAAQLLPGSASSAASVANSYASSNCVGIGGCGIDTPSISGGTVTVQAHEQAKTYFAQAFGLGDLTVQAKASATSFTLASAGNVIPVAMPTTTPALASCSGPCFGQTTSVALGQTSGNGFAPGGFGLL